MSGYQEGYEPQGFKQVTCKCCGGTRTETIWGPPYREPKQEFPKNCECPSAEVQPQGE